MKELISNNIKKEKSEAIVKFLKKHIVAEIILLLIVCGLIALKVFRKEISMDLNLAIRDKKKPYEDDGYDDDIDPLD